MPARKKTVAETKPAPTLETVETEVAPVLETSEVSAYDMQGRYIRTFSVVDHGENFMELAKQFASKGYTLK